MSTNHTNPNPDNLAKALINESGAARYVVDAEEHRVRKLLTGRYSVSDESAHTDFERSLADRPHLATGQPKHSETVATELRISRENIRNNIVAGIDDIAVDVHLGLRTDDCMLPPLFRELHRQAQEQAGHEISFLNWMADYATNEQLMNVWQWHNAYLEMLDNSPAFQERVSSIKAGYTEGSRQAIAAGVLHPDVAIPEPAMDAIRIIHGSPLSPIMAMFYADADPESSCVQVRDGVSDFILYHELSHFAGILDFEFVEGTADLIAAAIYNHSHPAAEHVNTSDLIYHNQIATLTAIERMTEDKVGLYELSRIYSGTNSAEENTIEFSLRVENVVGLPVILALLKITRGFDLSDVHSRATRRQFLNLYIRTQTEFLAAMMFDDAGNKVASTVQELVVRALSDATLRQYDPTVVRGGLGIINEIHALQERFSEKYSFKVIRIDQIGSSYGQGQDR